LARYKNKAALWRALFFCSFLRNLPVCAINANISGPKDLPAQKENTMPNTDTYKGIYAMHKYWGKKPFNEISKFIERYTEVGETVLDSFCGSGVTLVEALKVRRKCVGVDLNPIAIKLCKVSMTSVDIDKVTGVFKSLKKKLQPVINSLYEVEENGEKTLVTHVIWKSGNPIEVWYQTGTVKKKIRPGRDVDISMSNSPAIAPKWYPTARLFENSRINVGKEQTVADLFTPRALVALSLILDEIWRIGDEAIRDVFEVTFSGTLSQASKLVFVIRDRKKNRGSAPRAEVGSWVIGYWIPEEHFEINVWNCFENRFRRVLKGLKEINALFSSYPPGYFDEYVRLINGSATKLPLEDNSIDYAFIDPPHANRVLYLEQSLMWNAWLRLDMGIEWDKEIVVSEAKSRAEKGPENYSRLLSEAFTEIRRVLKPGRFFSMAFNSLDDRTWLDTLNIITRHGFKLHDIVPLSYSATSVIQDNRKNALKTDFVLTFKNEGRSTQSEIVYQNDAAALRAKIAQILHCHPDYEVYNVINELFTETIPKGYIHKVSHIIKACAEIMK